MNITAFFASLLYIAVCVVLSLAVAAVCLAPVALGLFLSLTGLMSGDTTTPCFGVFFILAGVALCACACRELFGRK